MGLMDRLFNLIGLEEVEEDEPERPVPAPREERRPRKNALVSLPGGGRAVRVVVVEPNSFDEVQAVADQLKNRRPVIVNLEQMEKEPAQQFLNFLSGTIYALDGTMQRVSTSIFLFAPPNVEVTGRERAEATSERGLNLFAK